MNRVVDQCAEEELTIYKQCFDADILTKRGYKQKTVKQKLKCTLIYSALDFGNFYWEALRELLGKKATLNGYITVWENF